MRWIDAILFVLTKEDKYLGAKQIFNEIIAMNLKDVKKMNCSIVSQTIRKYSTQNEFSHIKIKSGKPTLYYLEKNAFFKSIYEIPVPQLINHPLSVMKNSLDMGMNISNIKFSLSDRKFGTSVGLFGAFGFFVLESQVLEPSQSNNNKKIKAIEYQQKISLGRDNQVKIARIGFEVDFGHKFVLNKTSSRVTSNNKSDISFKYSLQPLEIVKQYGKMLSVNKSLLFHSDPESDKLTPNNVDIKFSQIEIIEANAREITDDDIKCNELGKGELIFKDTLYIFRGSTAEGTEVTFSKVIKLYFPSDNSNCR